MDKQLFDLLKTPQKLNWLEAALIRDGIYEGPEFESAFGVSIESAKLILFAWEAAQSPVWDRELLCQFIDSEIFPDRRIIQLRISAALPEKFTPADGLDWLKKEHIPIGDLDLWVQQNKLLSQGPNTAPPAPVGAASDTSALPKNHRPDLLTPLIEKAQSGETDPFNAALIWPKLCSMVDEKTRPLIGISDEGIKWTDGNDKVKFLSKKALGDRLQRQKKPR